MHILHDNTLTLENRDKFNQIAGRYGQIVKFYNVEILCSDIISRMKKLFTEQLKTSAFTFAMFYRLLVTELISSEINKIIYLDSDTIVNLNIRKLWQIEFGEKFLAAVTEKDNLTPIEYLPLCVDGFVNYEKYFNSGVLTLNLKMLRNERKLIEKGINFIAKNPRYKWCDQDILNYCFSENYFGLPLKFNQFVRAERSIGKNIVEEKIYHYNSSATGFNFLDNFNRLWFKYFEKTPYFNTDVIGRLYSGIQQMYVSQKNFAAQISAVISGKERAFFTTPQNVNYVKQIFYVKDSEEIIIADSNKAIQKLVDSMKKSHGKKVFFILEGFPVVYSALTQSGFKFGSDFLNASIFLSDIHGVPLDSHPLLKLL